MKHSIRFYAVDPIVGARAKYETVYCELGSGVFDKNGKEIFEGDTITDGKRELFIKFDYGALCACDRIDYYLLNAGYTKDFEVIGEAES